MRAIKKIIVHCSATREGQDIGIDTIREWHVNDRGWSDIGYHYVIELDGAVKIGRQVERTGAHTVGHNADSIGICYVGGVESDGITPKDTRTEIQKISLLNLITVLKSMYPDAIVYGHRDFSTKACPSFDAKKEYE
jgi:N-acetylmuramoyl-L-alanine amidase